jgi:hypothetical protein
MRRLQRRSTKPVFAAEEKTRDKLSLQNLPQRISKPDPTTLLEEQTVPMRLMNIRERSMHQHPYLMMKFKTNNAVWQRLRNRRPV